MMRRLLLEIGPPRSWVFYLPPRLTMLLLGQERSRRLAIQERDRLRSQGIWRER